MLEGINYLNKILKKEDVVVIGCSGGPDSMALLDLLIKERKEKKLTIICAHVNHKVRKESDDELVSLSKFCEKNDLIFESMSITNYGEDNFHNEARNIRYNFFEGLIKKYNAKYLLTAHHGDDLVETVLMRLVRGSTLKGYAGFDIMIDKEFYHIVRPLVFATKDEISRYCEKEKIEYATDMSNFSMKYTRNRYRKNVLPFLKSEEENVHLKFIKYSQTLFKYDQYVVSHMNKAIKKVVKDGKVLVDEFKNLEEIVQNRLILQLMEDFYDDDLFLISDIHTKLVRNIIYSKKANTCAYLPNNVIVSKNYNFVTLSKITEQIDTYEIELEEYVHLPNGKDIEEVQSSDDNSNFYFRLDYNDVKLPLCVRTRKNGDKMKIKGLNGSKKIKDIFIDSKIPMPDREIWPVVVDANDEVIWLPGLKKSKYDVPLKEKCDIIFRYY